MIVVFDTNIWLQHLYLRSPAGAAARFYLSQKNARVALPEVVRLEVEHHLRDDMSTYIKQIRDNYDRLLAVFGTLKEIILPNEQNIEQKVSEAFDSLGVDFIELPLSFASARNSFLRTINKVPPSDKSQQFKDGVLWADCLTLLDQDDVVLVSEDKAFYEGRTHSNGISTALRNECNGKPYKLRLLPYLPELLKEIRSEVTIDHDALTNAFLAKTGKSIHSLLQLNGFELADRTQLNADLFVTEQPKILFLEFKIEFRCTDVSELDRGPGTLTVRGDGLYNSATGEFSELGELGSALTFKDSEGVEQEQKSVVMRIGTLVIGHKDVSHTIRHKLD